MSTFQTCLNRTGRTMQRLQTIDARYKNSNPMPTCGPRFNTSPLAATRGTPTLTSTRMGSKRYTRPRPTLIEGCVMAVCMDRERGAKRRERHGQENETRIVHPSMPCSLPALIHA